MSQSHIPPPPQSAADSAPGPGLHLAFTALSAIALLLMLTALRIALLVYNRALIGDTPIATFAEAFLTGLRFDLRLVVYL